MVRLSKRGKRHLRINNEHSAGFCQIESNTTSLQRDQKDLYIGVVHEVLDALLSLLRAHGAIEHDSVETGAAEPPFDELQHGGELGKDNGFEGLLLAAELVEVVNEHFDFGRGGPVLHLDTIDD